MTQHLHYAAHVDHPLTHSSEIGRLSLSLGVAALAAVIVVVGTGGGAAVLSFSGAVAVAGASSTGFSVGKTLGTLVDTYIAPPSDGCFVDTGIDSVRLGRECKPAARADHDDTRLRGRHSDKLAEGSRIVMLGRELRPMSRVGDRSDCGGAISDGLRSLVVGGEPSREGEPIDEKTSDALAYFTLAADLVGAFSTAGGGGKVNLLLGAGEAVTAFTGGDAQRAVGLAGTAWNAPPKNALEWAGAANKGFDAIGRAVELVGP